MIIINRAINKIIQDDLNFITSSNLPWHNLKDSTFLITGATGFLAGFFVDTLLHLNKTRNLNIKVHCLVRDIKKATDRFEYARSENLKFLNSDLLRPLQIDSTIDYIVHAASLASPKQFQNSSIETILPNTIGNFNLLELAAQKKTKGFLFFSTTGVNGFVDDTLRPITEEQFGALDPMKIEHCYLESKRMGENMCKAWHFQKHVPVKIVRPAITFGPGITIGDGRSYADFIERLVNMKDIELYSDGTAIRNFCYLADATAGFFTVLLNGIDGECYNIATDQEISISELAHQLVNEVFPEKKLKVIYKNNDDKNYMRVNFSRTTVSINKAKKLGWKIKYSTQEGFRRTIDCYEDPSSRPYNKI